MTLTDTRTVTPPAAERAARPSATGRERVAALDGLRALGVLLIMGFHFGIGWLPGGFVGVDVFYVLSGFLITGLLVSEFRRRRAIALGSFWLRRARRLLPALLLMLVVVTLLVRYAAAPGLYPNFRMSALSSLFYFSNWWQIATSGNYFVATGPTPPLAHTWSLAVEEQFYLVWPLVVLGTMRLSRTFARGIRVLLVVAVAGVVASTLEMALRYSPTANTTRLYFGTDTHAQSVMIGAALACLLTIVQLRRGEEGMAPAARGRLGRAALGAVGLVGLAGLVVLSTRMLGTDGFTYRGGILLSALSAGAVLVAAVCVTGGLLSRTFSLRPLVWIGTVSYGAYLWHFPIAIFMDTSSTGLTGFWLLAARAATTFAVSAASYYLVERPIMTGTFWRSLRAIGPAVAAMAVTIVIVVAGTLEPAVAAVTVHRFVALPYTSTSRPSQVVVLGDSTGLTLGVALQRTAPPGTRVVNGGLFGCGLATGTWVSNDPPKPQLAMFPACDQSTPPAQQWPALDARALASTGRGDLALFIGGTWEVQDILRNGHWSNITQPAFQRYELRQMETVVRLVTARGAHLVFTTIPATAVGASFHEAPFPEDSVRRHHLYDALLEKVAARYPHQVSVLDLNAILSPGGTFHQYLDGVEVRTSDGIHTPAYTPGNPFAGNSSQGVADAFYNWVSPRIWPRILQAASGDSAGARSASART